MGFYRKEQITIFLTSNCNLSCSYCYMPKMHIQKEHQYIDLEFARAGLVDYFSTGHAKCLRFFSSGEPTLAFDHMRKIWEMAYSLAGPELITEIETNGFFDEEIAEWIEEHANIVWISCDGEPLVQNLQRPTINNTDSSSKVFKNIRRFSRNSHMQFGVRPTVSCANINKQMELVEFFASQGVKYVSASPIYNSRVNPLERTPNLYDFAFHFVPAFYKALEKGMFYQTLMIVNFDEEVDFYCQSTLPTPRLTSDGFVSSCDWASFGPKYLPNAVQQELIYGFYDKQQKKIFYDQDKIKKIQKRKVNYLGESYCRGCKALRHCAGGCVGKMIAATNNFFEPNPEWCKAVLYLHEHIKFDGRFPVLHP